MIRRFSLIFLLGVVAQAAWAADLTGDWTGVLSPPGAKLTLVLHITRSSGGALAATLDSVDQNAFGIPVKSVTLEGAKLALDVAAVHGSFAGTVSSDGKTIAGTWTQSSPLPLTFTRAVPSDIDGAWSGVLDTGMQRLRLLFHILNTASGLTATMVSVDQGGNAIPVAGVTRNGSSIRFDVAMIGGAYEAKISEDRQRMNGTWSQGGRSLPLALERVKNTSELQPKRPQEPKPPFPYTVRDVRYENKDAGLTLAATLTIPPGDGPFPAVLLICGSGPHDRDETLMGHKPFLVLSDFLTRHGIVTLRADKRGIGQSGGDYATATTLDFASDAWAGAEFLKTVPNVDPHRIGLIGHSEGADIAPIVAAHHPGIAFIVLMAGTGVPGDQIIVEQVRLLDEANGATPQQAEKAADEERAILDIVKSSDIAKLKGKVPDAAIAQLMSPWFRTFISLDPAKALREVHCPVLAVDGSKDLQVPPEQNLGAIRSALAAGGNKDVQTVEFPGLNHLFQHAKTGSPNEYAQIEETMAPEVMEKIAGWIRALPFSS